MTETETKRTVRRFVDGSSAAAAEDSLKPIGVTKEMLQTFFDSDVCQTTSKERASLFQQVADNTLRATEVVVRPSAAKKAEDLAKQADIRNSFLMSAASKEDEEASKSTKADGATSAPAEASTTSQLQQPLTGTRSSVELELEETTLEQELEKLMDEEDHLAASGSAPKAKPVPVPKPKTSAQAPKPKAKDREKATTATTKESKEKKKQEPANKAKASSSKASNFSGPKNEKQSRGSNFNKKK